MIFFLRGTDSFLHPELFRSMFSDRRAQFHDRLGWEVHIDRFGNERDEYDLLNPTYVIISNDGETHAASLRLLPTLGRTMINDHFIETLDGQEIRDERVWECTRLCVGKGAARSAVPKLLASTGFLMKQTGIRELVGVFDTLMLRQYSRLGASPSILGSMIDGDAEYFSGLWSFADVSLTDLSKRSGLDATDFQLSFVNSPVFTGEHA